MNGVAVDPALDGNGNVEPKNLSTAQSTSPDDDFSPYTTQVNDILKKKRKAREHKACYPCRQRKVRCDLSRPCKTCTDRDHPELCTYQEPSKRLNVERDANDAGPGSTVVLGRDDFDKLMKKLDRLENSMSELRNQLGNPDSSVVDPALRGGNEASFTFASTKKGHTALHGLHSSNDEGETVHYGAGSVPAMLSSALNDTDNDAAQRKLREQLNSSLTPLYGLDETATYPFPDLWGLPHTSLVRFQELAKVLPDDTQALYLLRSHKTVPQVIFPSVGDMGLFEQELTSFLVQRATSVYSEDAVTRTSIFGQTYYWLGLLFAVFASGAQASDMPLEQASLSSQVYLCCAAECMRITNFLARPNLFTIQTLLAIQSVLMNNCSAGTAWNMTGLTIRLSQSLGLHQPCPPDVVRNISYSRSRIWWAVLWLDSQLSIIYDRAGTRIITSAHSMPMPKHLGQASDYHSAMFSLARISLDIIHLREQLSTLPDAALTPRLWDTHARIMTIPNNTADHLKDLRHCHSMQDKIEFWTLHLHLSYTTAELCRPALDHGRNLPDHKPVCIDSLIDTIDAFLGLHSVTSYARKSWASLHRALSSALLLGIVGELNVKNQRAISAAANFINAVRDITTGLDPSEIIGPIKRGIIALHRLRIPGAEFPLGLVDDDRLDSGNTSKLCSQTNADGDENSPHSLMNSILWGIDGPAGNPANLPMPW